jgi:urease accessory protein
MEATVSSGSALFLLPDPVTCFRSAAYNQMQTFRLQGGASLALLDWVTSGRKSLGEEWAFSSYYSINEVWVDKQRVAKDVLLLEAENPEVDSGSVVPAHRTLAASLAPYSCYATVILYGPLVRGAIRHLSSFYGMISVFKTREPADLVWSLSPISSDAGSVLRVAGKETDTVRRWLSENLVGLADVVGAEAYSRAFK